MVTCPVCGKDFHENGFNSHFQRMHNGVTIRANNTNGSLASKAANDRRKAEYENNPKQCKCCNTPLPYDKRNGTFCNRSCSASYNNTGKSKSDQTKQKLSRILTVITNHKSPPVCKVAKCDNCNCYFHKLTRSKYCSDKCKKDGTLAKTVATRGANWNVSNNRGRHKKSYLEKSFADWLHSKSVTFRDEYLFKRYDQNGKYVKNYFADFYFPQFDLIIELDRSQHANTVAYDNDRDSYLSTTYSVTVVRITHSEYVKKLRYCEICKLLNV